MRIVGKPETFSVLLWFGTETQWNQGVIRCCLQVHTKVPDNGCIWSKSIQDCERCTGESVDIFKDYKRETDSKRFI